MAELYCDHGLYGTPIAGGTVPTASEEGNGKAIGAATMATRTITINNWASIVTSQALTVAGVSFPANTGTNNFAAATSNNQTAINLAAAINASTTNATQPAGFVNTAVVRNLVNATVSGAVVTIYTRCSGSEWNSITETSTLSGVTITQWSGGADGAWGYLLNTASIFPTAKTAITYGLLASLPFLGAINPGDVVNIRSNKTIAYSSSVGQTVTLPVMGSALLPVIYKIDNSTLWADGSNPVVNINITKTVSGAFVFTYAATTFVIVQASVYPSDLRGLSFNLVSGTGTISIYPANGGVEFDGLRLASVSSISITLPNNDNSYRPLIFRDGVISTPQVSSALVTGGGGNGTVEFINTTFIQNGAVTINNGLFLLPTNQTAYYILKSCSFLGFVTGSRLVPNTTVSATSAVVATDCVYNQITVLGPTFNSQNVLTGTGVQGTQIHPTGLFSSSRFGNRPFVIDTPVGFVEWNDTLSFPTLSAVLVDGVTPWSIKAIPSTVTTNTSKLFPLKLPSISKLNSLSTAARTLTLELGIEKNITTDKSNIWIEYTYEDDTGVVRTESTFDYAGGALTASTATWTNLVNDGGTDRFTYNNSGVLYFNRHKIALTTAYSIKTGTEIVATVNIGKYADTLNSMYFIDPNISVV